MARNKYDVDEMLEDSFDMGQIKRLAQYILPYKCTLIYIFDVFLPKNLLCSLFYLLLQRQ